MNYRNFTRTLPIESSIIMNSLIVQHIRNINIPRQWRGTIGVQEQKNYKYMSKVQIFCHMKSVNTYVHIYSRYLFIYHMYNIIISIFYTCSSLLTFHYANNHNCPEFLLYKMVKISSCIFTLYAWYKAICIVQNQQLQCCTNSYTYILKLLVPVCKRFNYFVTNQCSRQERCYHTNKTKIIMSESKGGSASRKKEEEDSTKMIRALDIDTQWLIGDL